nr:hypothetical protein [Pandoravirus aubagnensis]
MRTSADSFFFFFRAFIGPRFFVSLFLFFFAPLCLWSLSSSLFACYKHLCYASVWRVRARALASSFLNGLGEKAGCVGRRLQKAMRADAAAVQQQGRHALVYLCLQKPLENQPKEEIQCQKPARVKKIVPRSLHTNKKKEKEVSLPVLGRRKYASLVACFFALACSAFFFLPRI